ncbi:cysteine-rich CWC family protein [Paenibacillus nasutitermitis]|uniref:cysteine-rich CWC family protein n=1 Tax=Paenibacillus nasutitermitis TaxID=1652958 RepID=UPI00166A456E|nr:cysteine-rich CWC family protein [Paenibacillus nasutitermitis]
MNDVKRCPLCGQDNECGNPAGEPEGTCWCYGAYFPGDLLDRVTEELSGKSCICKKCLEKHLESPG